MIAVEEKREDAIDDAIQQSAKEGNAAVEVTQVTTFSATS